MSLLSVKYDDNYYDGIKYKDLNFEFYETSPELFNFFIKLNSFPRSCKIAKVKPLFKKGCKTDPQNYRPISLPPHSTPPQIIKNYWKGYSWSSTRAFE